MSKEQIAVIGCGLIGGSLSQALKQKRPSSRIVGIDRQELLPAIEEASVAHEVVGLDKMNAVLPECTVVILATPVEVILQQLQEIAPFLNPGTVVSDVGSTKTEIMERARATMPAGVHFVGGHPIAGSEQSGVAASDPLLFKDRAYVLCPFQDTPPSALITLLDIVDDVMALPVTLDPEEHDRVIALTSHVPQLLAIGLVHAATTDDATHGLLELLAGKGFLDLTRVAASDFAVWRGILETNRRSIFDALGRLEGSLALIREKMSTDRLQDVWEIAHQKRRKMGLESISRPRKPDLRRLVDRWDEQILRALGNRLRVVDKIGALKKNRNDSVYDPDRERRLLLERKKWAKSLAIPEDLVDELFSVIMKHSKKLQSS